jgi:hypothetical protein
MHVSIVEQQSAVDVHLSPSGAHEAFGGLLPHTRPASTPASADACSQ